MATRGYHSYRGRTSKGKIVLSVVLVLVIAVAVGFLLLQKYIVYDGSGTPHLVLPQQDAPEQTTDSPQEDLDITVEDAKPGEGKTALLQAVQLGENPADWPAQLTDAYNAFAVTMKAPGGQWNYPFDVSMAGAETSPYGEAVKTALPALLDGKTYSIARLSCLRDGGVARANLETMGLKNTGGYAFYDGNNENWLDPAKEATRTYLAQLAVECADLGFDEILLTDLTYPTEGKVSKIAYGSDPRYETQTAYNTEQIAQLLQLIKAALGDRKVTLSLEVPETVLTNNGVDETAGIDLWNTLMARLSRIYVPTTEDRVDALVGDTMGDGTLIPELTAVPTAPSYRCYLITAENS